MTADRVNGAEQQVASRQRVTLPAPVMAAAKTIASDASIAPPGRLTGVLMLIWGYAWFEQQPEIDPRAIALPNAQWEEICGLLVSGVPDDKVNMVNLGLSFMNSGPSSYTD